MGKREQRVINAFINCVKAGEFTLDYATTLIEDNDKYGYLTEEAKETFYEAFEQPEDVVEDVVEEETPIEEEESEEQIDG